MSWVILLIIFIIIPVLFGHYLNSQELLSLKEVVSLESAINAYLIYVLVAITGLYVYETHRLVEINQKQMKRDWVRQQINTICKILNEFSTEKKRFEERTYDWGVPMDISEPREINNVDVLLEYPGCRNCYRYYTEEYKPKLEKLTGHLSELLSHTNEFLENDGYRGVLPDSIEDLDSVDIRKIRDFIVRKLNIGNMSGDEGKKHKLLEDFVYSKFRKTNVYTKMAQVGIEDAEQYAKINMLIDEIKKNNKNAIDQIDKLSKELKLSVTHIENELRDILKKLGEEYAIPEECIREGAVIRNIR
jgi:hypothetical protein